MVSNDIKTLLAYKGVKQKELMEVLNLTSRQTVSAKFSRNSFTSKELCKIVHFLGGQLVVKFDDGREFEIRGDEE